MVQTTPLAEDAYLIQAARQLFFPDGKTPSQQLSTSLLVLPKGKEGEAAWEAKVDQLMYQLHARAWGEVGRLRDPLNPESNRLIVRGETIPEDHYDLTDTFGSDASATNKVQDAGFYSVPIAILRGIMQTQGYPYSLRAMGEHWEDQRRDQAGKVGAEAVLRKAAALAREGSGQDVQDIATDPSVYVPDSPDELMEKPPFQQQLEGELYTRLGEAIHRGMVVDKLLDGFENATVDYKQFGLVYDDGGMPNLELFATEQVGYWGKEGAKSADDMYLFVVQDKLTATDVVGTYGPQLEAAGIQGDKLTNLWASSAYDLHRQQYPTEFRDEQLTTPMNPSSSYDLPETGPLSSLVRQRIWVLLLRKLYFRVYTDVDDQGAPISLRAFTKPEMDAYRKGRYRWKERLKFEAIDEDSFSAGEESVLNIPIQQWWESTALRPSWASLTESVVNGGWDWKNWGTPLRLINRRPVPYQEREPGRLRRPRPPFVADIERRPSLVTLGRSIRQQWINVMAVIRRKVAQAGGHAVVYDMAMLPKGWEWEDVAGIARDTGVVLINSARNSGVNGADKGRMTHMQTIDLSAGEDIVRLINLAKVLKDQFFELCGVTPQMLGQFGQRETTYQSQAGMSQGTLATHQLYGASRRFASAVYSRMAALGKYLWANAQGPMTPGVALDVVRDMALHHFGVYVENSGKNQEDKQIILRNAEKALSSGQLTMREFGRLFFTESPYEMREIFETGLDAYEKSRQELEQGRVQAQQQMAQATAERVQMPLAVERERTNRFIQVEQIKGANAQNRTDRQVDYMETKADMDAEQNARMEGLQYAATDPGQNSELVLD